MSHLATTTRTGMVRVLLTAAAVLPCTDIAASACSPSPVGTSGRSTDSAELRFTTAADAVKFHAIATKACVAAPDARHVAQALIKARFGVDGDEYVLAHFATANNRFLGKPDHVIALTDALMGAFPEHSRHAFFAELADAVGGLNAGGSKSPGIVSFLERATHSKNAGEFFRNAGRFFWSRTGPGYLYNTFLADGNVVATVREDARPLDEAFGVFRAGGFSADHASSMLPSQMVDVFENPGLFAELPYVKQLDSDLDRYWEEIRTDWPMLARYEFVRQARRALAAGVLTEGQYARVMKGGAPRVPLHGPIALDQLRQGPRDDSVVVRRFDINGYPASDLVRFLGADGSEVMYVPGGDPAFVVAKNADELGQWVLAQAKDPAKLDALLSHFSIYDSQDGSFWTGVKHGLENIASGAWKTVGGAVDHANAVIDGDIFEDMRAQTENRRRDDARMQVSTAWDAWRTRINRASTILAPLGYMPVLAIPIQLGTGIAGIGTGVDQAMHGRTTEERKSGLEQAATVFTNVPLGFAFGGTWGGDRKAVHVEGERPFFHAPSRMNGKMAYPLSPVRPPRLPVDTTNRLYVRRDGALGLWVANDAQRHVTQMPGQARRVPDGTFVDGENLYGAWGTPDGSSAIRLAADGGVYRMLLDDGTAGPLVKKDDGGTWSLAFAEDDYVEGSVLAHMVPHKITASGRVFNRTAQILKQFGTSEALLPTLSRPDTGPSSADPMVMMSLGHGFIETLPARLRDPSANVWSLMELQLVAPVMTERTRMPLAVFNEAGEPVFAVLPDGSDIAPELLPVPSLRVQRRGKEYLVLNRNMRATQHSYRSIFAAVEASSRRLRDTQGIDDARLEQDFRSMLADSIDARSSRPELERMHRLWIDPLRVPGRQKQLIKDLSRLRHALVDWHEPLTSEQMHTLLGARVDPHAPSSVVAALDAGAIVDGMLARIADRESALLPAALEFLVVKEPSILARALTEATDAWTVDHRHYVRLRHLDGRTQIVETNPEQGGAGREILEPGSRADRRTGRILIETDGMWYPEPWLREGFAPIDPREAVVAAEAVTAKLPVADRENHEAIAHVVDSIPQPLLRFVSTSLDSIDVAADGGLALKVRHPEAASSMTYLTHVDRRGQHISPVRVEPMPPEPLGPFVADRQLVLPVLQGMRDGAPGSVPNPDPRGYLDMLHSQRPISEFIARGIGDRHVSTLANTRRIRGMLREDTNVALVGTTPDHALTLVMPADDGTMRWIGLGRSDGRLLGELPAGTVIVDNLYRVSALAEKYPALVREVAREWEASGSGMLRVTPDGREQIESPVAFTERMLATPLRINLWNPKYDPISEQRYVEYLYRRRALGLPVRHAGLDWLVTPEARRDYMAYFAPPFNVMPFGDVSPGSSQAAARVRALAEGAVEVSFLKY